MDRIRAVPTLKPGQPNNDATNTTGRRTRRQNTTSSLSMLSKIAFITLSTLIALSLSTSFRLVKPASALPHESNNCGSSQNDCEYFGCFSKGEKCPQDCDTFSETTCPNVKLSSGNAACEFNPAYSNGKGLCQKKVTCTYFGDGKCSADCIRCEYFGCVPSGTNCPLYCESFGSKDTCEGLGGIAGGLACQWDGAKCGPVPFASLTRKLAVTPLDRPVLTVRNGQTMTPTPTGTPTPVTTSAPSGSSPTSGSTPAPPQNSTQQPEMQQLDWQSNPGSPQLIAIYVGLGTGFVAFVMLVAWFCYRKNRKDKKNRILAAGVAGSPDQGDTMQRPTLSSPPVSRGGENAASQRPKVQFHRESLIFHVRRAVGNLMINPSTDGAINEEMSPKGDLESPTRLPAMDQNVFDGPPAVFTASPTGSLRGSPSAPASPTMYNLKSTGSSSSVLSVDAESPLGRIIDGSRIDPSTFDQPDRRKTDSVVLDSALIDAYENALRHQP